MLITRLWMVNATRVNYVVAVVAGIVFLGVGLYRLYQGLDPPLYSTSPDDTLILVGGLIQTGLALVWLYFVSRTGGRLSLSKE